METYELLQEMDKLFKVFIRARSLTTYVSEDIIDYVQGKNCTHIILDYDTLYNEYGYTTCLFIEPENFSTHEKYNEYKSMGSWINASFFIHLNVLIEKYIKELPIENKKSSDKITDNDYYKILRLLRNKVAHNPFNNIKITTNNKDNCQCFEQLINTYFKQCIKENNELDISIDKFVIPLYQNIYEFIEAEFS